MTLCRRCPVWRCIVVSLMVLVFFAGPSSSYESTTGKTNPYQSGCLRAKEASSKTTGEPLPMPDKLRVCNSEDPPEALGNTCRNETDFGHTEIRISSENWSSVILEVWILQILLSEVLDVPTTVETGFPGAMRLNFYDANASFGEVANGQDWTTLERASRLRDCRLADKDPENYEPCAHFIPEVWDFSVRDEFRDYVANDLVEMPQGLGALVQEGWYIPRFTAERDSSLLSYLGLAGDQNRHKLAQEFQRPTTWQDYCTQVSPSNCTVADEFAQRPPRNETEHNRMFVEGLYTGHFRNTSQNDCETFPENCTGHIVDYPCGWFSYIGPQTHHLDIALESNGAEPNSGGYSYDQMVEIWRAANATKSNVVMIWWQPDVLYQEFLGTDAEFMRVTLPPPTQACSKSRITIEDRCSDDPATRVGDPEGACDMEVVSVQKAVATGLQNASVDDGTQSPGHEFLSRFRITELQINELFAYWLEKDDPREAVCQWVVDNRDVLNGWIPRTYPRKLSEDQAMKALTIVAIIMASIAMLIVAWITSFVYRKRDSTVMVFAQIEFLYMLLSGLLVIALGAILEAVPATEASCVASIWLIHLGYTLELVPLIVKVAAINRLVNAAKKMRRVSVQKRFLGGLVCSILGLATVVLALWTGFDPRKPQTEYEISSEEPNGDDGYTLVVAKTFCGSESVVYNYVFVAWTTLLLLCATILAFQMRHNREDFNESQTLAMMIYSHFLFVVLRLIVLFLRDSLDKSNLQTWESLIYSFDVLATVLIYFVPKVVAVYQGRTFTSLSYSDSRISVMGFMVGKDNKVPSSRISGRHGPTSLRTASSRRSTATNGSVGCKHCRGYIRKSVVDETPMPEPNVTPEEEDEDRPKWCSSEYVEVQKLLPPTTESSNEQDKAADKASNLGGDAAVEPLVDPLPGTAKSNEMDSALTTNFDVDDIKNTEDSSSVHSSEHNLTLENLLDE